MNSLNKYLKQIDKKTMLASAALGILLLASTGSQAGKYDGVRVKIMTFTGPQIAEPLQRRAPEFKKLTGAEIEIITVPYSDLYTKLLTDFSTGTNSIDAAVFAPQWMVDYVVPGYLEDLSSRVAADSALEADDISPFFREFSQQFNGKTYMLTLDGDFHMVYYRTDVFKKHGIKAPETWSEYINAAHALHGRDMNGDGVGDYGSCIFKKRNAQAFWTIYSIAGSFIQSKGTRQGAFFNTKDMSPMVNNEAFAAALDVYKNTSKYGPPGEINMDVGETRTLFVAGRCALALDWGDIGPLAIDPSQSKVNDKVGAILLPGSTRVLNWETGKLVNCNATTCPYAVNGVNHAPYAAFGGWSGGINASGSDKVKNAAYDFFSYMSQPAQSNVDVTIGKTGFNPYRLSQFQDLSHWTRAGMSERAAKDYLNAIQGSLASPNMMLDLRIPKNQNYQQVVLDTALARFLAGELDKAGTMKAIEAGWNELNEDEGVEDQLKFYKSTLGR